jgi:hypothetical protein
MSTGPPPRGSARWRRRVRWQRWPPPSRACRHRERDYELELAKTEVARLSEALKEMAVRLTTLVEGKAAGAMWPGPRRVDAATKAGLLELLGEALAAGWTLRRACWSCPSDGCTAGSPAGPAASSPTGHRAGHRCMGCSRTRWPRSWPCSTSGGDRPLAS